jgi:hypothetical protein
MKKIVLFLIFLLPFISTAQWSQLGSEIDGQTAGEQSGTSISLNSSGTILAVSAPRAMDNAVMKGKVRLFEWNGSSWIQKGSDILGSNQGDVFGESISISANGNTVIVGAPSFLGEGYLSPTGPTGYARVFEWNGSNWIQKGIDINGTAPNDIAGSAVSINENGTIIGVSFPGFDGANGANCGAIRTYEWNGSTWIQKGQDVLGPNTDAYIGSLSMNASGNIIAIGSGGDDTGGSNAGSVKIFEFNGTSWTQKGNTVLGNNSVLQGHGSTLAIDNNGTNFITGGYSFTNGAIGYAKVYTWNGTNWVPKGQTLVSNIGSDFFGTSVAISTDGNIVGVGGLIGTANNGHARIFKFVGNSWLQQGSDVLGETVNDQFGRSVGLSANGSILAAGTPYNDGNGNNAGHVRVFENSTLSTSSFTRNTISIYPNPSSDYIEVTGLTSPDTYIIYSVLGTKISSGTISSNQKIDIQNYSTGVYFLKLENEEVLKFIKN